jgi:cell division septation protein DedD
VPRVVVPNESEERALDQSHRRRKGVLLAVVLVCVVGAAAVALTTYRARGPKVSADTVFVSAPAWPKPDARQAAPRPAAPLKEWLVQVGAFTNKKDAEALAARLEGVGRPVSVVAPISAADSLNKVMVGGMADGTTARRLADSLGRALGRSVSIIEPTGIRAR